MLVPRALGESLLAPGIVSRLAELGYKEGERLVLDYRSSEGNLDQTSKLARELLEHRCDLIFVVGSSAREVRAVRDVAPRIPIVFLTVGADPQEDGVVLKLGKPEANVTGVYSPETILAAKRLDILREIVPTARRFLVFSDRFTEEQLAAVVRGASRTGVELTIVRFDKQPYDFAAGVETGRQARVEGFVHLISPVLAATSAQVAELLVAARIPSVSNAAFVPSGFLIGYGIVNLKRLTGRAAEMAVKILNGTKPGDIPVEQFDEVETIVNAKTAKALGVTIPESIRARSARIVQ